MIIKKPGIVVKNQNLVLPDLPKFDIIKFSSAKKYEYQTPQAKQEEKI
jgi:hypothetical protein